MIDRRNAWIISAAASMLLSVNCATAGVLRAVVLDSESGQLIPARIYLQSEAGEWFFVTNDHPEGTALPYREQWVPMANSVERHTTVSAHPFQAKLKPGKYTITVERGKEYRTRRVEFEIGDEDIRLEVKLNRWINLAKRGWYSGETHVHRRLQELPNVMLAEDLNVAFPVTFWTTRSDAAPDLAPSVLRRQGASPFGPRQDAGVDPIQVDATHVILPRNTEYEVFSVNGKRHVLGAVFLLNHRSRFTAKAPPVAAIAEQAHAEGALLDLDKHSWPWSMMLVPVAKVDLFELSNNSVWRTKFGFRNLPAGLPEWMELETDSPTTLTEWGWLVYGFKVYYALLNCGFHITPTAGTASGVHPVPLGHSRVYVHTGDTFETNAWLKGLKEGRSFVTTGPMLFTTVNGKQPGETFQMSGEQTAIIEIESVSERPTSLEIIVNGTLVKTISPNATKTDTGALQFKTKLDVTITETSWLAVRSIEQQTDGRKRFAHTAPWHFSFDENPIVPKKTEVEWFIELMQREITRNREVVSSAALAEFELALKHYKNLLTRARK